MVKLADIFILSVMSSQRAMVQIKTVTWNRFSFLLMTFRFTLSAEMLNVIKSLTLEHGIGMPLRNRLQWKS